MSQNERRKANVLVSECWLHPIPGIGLLGQWYISKPTPRMIRALRLPLLRRMCTTTTTATTTAASETADMHRKKIVVFGGNGFVGSAIVKAALDAGNEVVSINRSGKPAHFKYAGSGEESKLTWVQGDIFEAEQWRDQLETAAAVISTVGAFGSNEVSV
jgi:hypothetical protein